jgi:hypothetical protein
MKSFKQYLNEFVSEVDLEHIAKLVARDCKPFLSEIDNEPGAFPLFRGMEPDNKLKINVRKNRLPRNTPLGLHTVIDEWFIDNFDYPYRSNAVFCSGELSQADVYGDPHMIFPIGNFSFVWSSRYQDLYSKVIRHETLSKYNSKFDPQNKDLKDDIDLIMSYGEYTDSDLITAISSMTEIMIACDSYYAIPYRDAFGTPYNTNISLPNIVKFGELIKKHL